MSVNETRMFVFRMGNKAGCLSQLSCRRVSLRTRIQQVWTIAQSSRDQQIFVLILLRLKLVLIRTLTPMCSAKMESEHVLKGSISCRVSSRIGNRGGGRQVSASRRCESSPERD